MTQMAKTLEQIADNEIVRHAVDRKKSVIELMNKVLVENVSRIHDRSTVQVETSEGWASNLDWFSAFSLLQEAGAHVTTDQYDRIQQRSIREGETVASEEERGGKVLTLVSNKENHAFSVMLLDKKVHQQGRFSRGAPRNFQIVSPLGELYHGIGDFRVVKEKEMAQKYLERFQTSQGRIDFKYLAHPNMAFSFVGAPHIALKAVVERIEDESRAYRGLARYIRNQLGVQLGPGEEYVSTLDDELEFDVRGAPAVTLDEETEPVSITTLEARVEGVGPRGLYPILSMNRNGEVSVEYDGEESFFKKYLDQRPFTREKWKDILRFSDHRGKLTWQLGAHRIRALSRQTDLAFFKHGFDGERKYGNETTPSWDIPEWKNWRHNRIDWRAMQFGGGVFLFYRLKETQEQILKGALDETAPPTQHLYT